MTRESQTVADSRVHRAQLKSLQIVTEFASVGGCDPSLAQATNAQQQQQIEGLAAGLQKVSAAVELNKPTPTQVADNR